MMHTILFICTGNVCRSPMAEGLFNAQARRVGEQTQFVAESAGTRALEHQSPTNHAITVMAQRGIDISRHRGQTVSRDMLASSDLVIVMARNHLEALNAEFPAHRYKLHLMFELKGLPFDVGDPYGGTLDEYEHCARLLDDLIAVGLDKIKLWLAGEKRLLS